MKKLGFFGSTWSAFAPEKEAWKRDGNFYTGAELRQMDQVDDFSMSEPTETALSAD
jgi:hypothetical protein